MKNKNYWFDISSFHIGMKESFTKTIILEDIHKFSELSGDFNLIHINEDFAKNSRYGKRLAHGLLIVSYFSKLFGTKLPGNGCTLANQKIVYKKPIYLDDTVEVNIEIIEINELNRKIKFRTYCKVKHRMAIDGEAEVFLT
jgi:3-hydroxybutyryl-CoA dehydratase